MSIRRLNDDTFEVVLVFRNIPPRFLCKLCGASLLMCKLTSRYHCDCKKCGMPNSIEPDFPGSGLATRPAVE